MKQFIKQVTVTGADDSIHPDTLLGLSVVYPFLEFGILVSKNNVGSPRFPSRHWLEELRKAKLYGVNLSMHLCGSWVRSLCLGDGVIFKNWISAYFGMFNRIQLNFHGQHHRIGAGFKFIGALRGLNLPIIFQLDGENNHLYKFACDNGIRAYPLYDLSGGAGVLPSNWFKPQGSYCGYAGGLSPGNLQRQLGKLSSIVGNTPIWIDSETHLRSNNGQQFDIDKVVHFLEIAKPYIVNPSASGKE